jgi:hypothetical protein
VSDATGPACDGGFPSNAPVFLLDKPMGLGTLAAADGSGPVLYESAMVFRA